MTTIGIPALATVDMVISRGADNDYKFIYSTSDGATPPTITPVNLTGWHARSQIRSAPGGTVWCTLSDVEGDIVLGADGTITLAIAHDVTEVDDWDSFRVGVWDLELTQPSGDVIRFVQGAVTLSQDVTR